MFHRWAGATVVPCPWRIWARPFSSRSRIDSRITVLLTPKIVHSSGSGGKLDPGVSLPLTTPLRGENGKSGNATTPGTHSANVVQQDYFAAVATRAVRSANG